MIKIPAVLLGIFFGVDDFGFKVRLIFKISQMHFKKS